MTEEDKLRQMVGNGGQFRVPDGYFEHFVTQMSAKIAELETEEAAKVVPLGQRFRRWRYAVAASVVVCVLGGAALLSGRTTPTDQQAAGSQYAQDYSIDQIADYAMLDNEDFYSYLSDY